MNVKKYILAQSNNFEIKDTNGKLSSKQQEEQQWRFNDPQKMLSVIVKHIGQALPRNIILVSLGRAWHSLFLESNNLATALGQLSGVSQVRLDVQTFDAYDRPEPKLEGISTTRNFTARSRVSRFDNRLSIADNSEININQLNLALFRLRKLMQAEKPDKHLYVRLLINNGVSKVHVFGLAQAQPSMPTQLLILHRNQLQQILQVLSDQPIGAVCRTSSFLCQILKPLTPNMGPLCWILASPGTVPLLSRIKPRKLLTSQPTQTNDPQITLYHQSQIAAKRKQLSRLRDLQAELEDKISGLWSEEIRNIDMRVLEQQEATILKAADRRLEIQELETLETEIHGLRLDFQAKREIKAELDKAELERCRTAQNAIARKYSQEYFRVFQQLKSSLQCRESVRKPINRDPLKQLQFQLQLNKPKNKSTQENWNLYHRKMTLKTKHTRQKADLQQALSQQKSQYRLLISRCLRQLRRMLNEQIIRNCSQQQLSELSLLQTQVKQKKDSLKR